MVEKGPQPKSNSEQQEAYQLLSNFLSKIREPLSVEKRALKKEGWLFFTLDPKSLKQIREERRRDFGHVSDFGDIEMAMVNYAPPTITIAVHPSKLAMPESFGQTKKAQLSMVGEQSRKMQQVFPDARMTLLPTCFYAQLDDLFLRKTGKRLFVQSFTHTLDTTSNSNAVFIGRRAANDRLVVYNWKEITGNLLGAFSVLVFVGK